MPAIVSQPRNNTPRFKLPVADFFLDALILRHVCEYNNNLEGTPQLKYYKMTKH
jgi:hypothetical protein